MSGNRENRWIVELDIMNDRRLRGGAGLVMIVESRDKEKRWRLDWGEAGPISARRQPRQQRPHRHGWDGCDGYSIPSWQPATQRRMRHPSKEIVAPQEIEREQRSTGDKANHRDVRSRYTHGPLCHPDTVTRLSNRCPTTPTAPHRASGATRSPPPSVATPKFFPGLIRIGILEARTAQSA